MKLYLISLGAGIVVGAFYAAIGVRSPAPPLVALLGLFGMLVGAQSVPVAQRLLSGQPLTRAWFSAECVPQITGAPPPSPSGK